MENPIISHLNKYFIYILFSFILSFIIIKFYTPKKSNTVKITFFVILLFFFFFFFYFVNMNRYDASVYEKFENSGNKFNYYYGDNDILKYDFKNTHLDNNIGSNMVEPLKNKIMHNITSEEEHHIIQNHPIMHQIQEEESHIHNVPKPQPVPSQDVSKIIFMDNNRNTCPPININVSYNGENEKKTNKKSCDCGKKTCNSCSSCNSDNSGNCLGDYSSRVHNNSDWLYGSQAWNDSRDYYIQNEASNNPDILFPPRYNMQNNNNGESCNTKEFYLKPKYDGHNVSPLMINTPWSEFKSGDKNPQ